MATLAGNLAVDGKTISHYIDILTDLLLIRRLEPWHENVKKRLIKSPRFYIRDSGILHRLLGIDCYDGLLSNPIIGKSWEGFVIENILSILLKDRQANNIIDRTVAAFCALEMMRNIEACGDEVIITSHGKPKLVIKPYFEQKTDPLESLKSSVVHFDRSTCPVVDDDWHLS